MADVISLLKLTDAGLKRLFLDRWNMGTRWRPMLEKALRASIRRPPALGPEKISVAGLPVTGCELFGREEDIAFLNDAWANKQVNVVTVVAWAGVGKSTLVNLGSDGWLLKVIVLQS